MALVAVIGFCFGFVGSIPVAGPISILVLERGLSGRQRSGLWIAVGAAVAESVYAALAFFGLGALLVRYPAIVPASQAAGAAALLTLGVLFAWRGPGRGEPAAQARVPSGSDALLGFTITALNPTFIATWTAAVTAAYATGLIAPAPGHAPLFAVGVGVGIVVWFVILLALTRRYGPRLSRPALGRVVRLLGVVLIGMGGWFAVRFVRFLFA
jgi:threonine/homoserine/homoserine lactone efflux protein